MIEKLSNLIIKAYKKRNGLISFHFRTHLFIKTNASFSVSTYLTSIRIFFSFENGHNLEFDKVYLDTIPMIKYNGEYIVSEIHCTMISELKSIKNSLVDLKIVYSFFWHPCVDPDEFKCKAIVKWMF